MMGSTRSQITDEAWMLHKDVIRRLYVVDEVPLNQLLVEVGNLGLAATKSQLEYKLKMWGFRRKLDRDDWVAVDRKITKRKQKGKDSEVIFCGKRLKTSKVEKETKRNRDYRIFIPTNAIGSSAEPKPQMDSSVSVCTPESLPMEFTWPGTLPWLQFQATHFPQLLSKISQADDEDMESVELLQGAHSKTIVSALFGCTSNLGSVDSQPQVSHLAATIGKSIPESYPEENLQCAQTLLRGSAPEVLRQCLSIVLYMLSNNLSDLQNNENWNLAMQILQHCGIFNFQVNIKELKDATLSAFMENLFRIVVYRLTNPRNVAIDSGEPLTILKWLLSSGQCPNVIMTLHGTFGHTVTPLHAAIRVGNIALMEHLLDAGADVNLILSHNNPETPLELALKMYGLGDKIVSNMADVLLRYGASANLETALHLAIWRRDGELAVAITQQGADICGSVRTQNGFLYEETSLSAAAAVGETETRFVLSLFKTRYSDIPPASFVTADVLIAAAAEKRDDTIQLLHDISPDSIFVNHYGISPLHAAARKGHLSTCRLLMELYGSRVSDISYSCPLLHVASCGGHEEIVRLFIDAGANVDAVAMVGDSPERKTALERCRLDLISCNAQCHLTPLECFDYILAMG